jgi:hypothetical protein
VQVWKTWPSFQYPIKDIFSLSKIPTIDKYVVL